MNSGKATIEYDVNKLTVDQVRVAVAQKLGWRIDWDFRRHWTECTDLKELALTAPGEIFIGERTINDVPDYPRDIAAAWTLVDELLKRGFYPKLYPCTWNTPPSWFVRLDAFEPIWGPTVQLAICNAFLIATL